MVTLPPYTAKDLQVGERLWLPDEDGSKQGNPLEKSLSLAGSRKVPAFWESHLYLGASEGQGAAQRAAESFWGLRVAQVIETTLVPH